MEELQDQIEFLSEIYEGCAMNKVAIELLTNALLHYCYLPVVIPALVGATKSHNAPNISISTALYVVTQTFKSIKSQQLHNALGLILVHNKIPMGFQRRVQTRKPIPEPTVSYR